MKTLYINGSPRGDSSNSASILKDLAQFQSREQEPSAEVPILTLSRKLPADPSKVLEKMNECDQWVLSLPLYVDALPGHLCWWLSRFQEYRSSLENPGEIRVYGIVNCGFPEAIQNRDALKILELFCLKAGLSWRFGIGVGMGEPYKQMAGVPLNSPMKKQILAAFQAVEADMIDPAAEQAENCFAAVLFPLWLYRFMGSIGWVMTARKNGLKRKDLYARPLQDE